MTMSFDPDAVQNALRKAWSLATASQWTADNPAAGQCNVTALLVHELFGGDLLKTPLPAGGAGCDEGAARRAQSCFWEASYQMKRERRMGRAKRNPSSRLR
jgi:hypothetical protein